MTTDPTRLGAWDYTRALLLTLLLCSQCVSSTPTRPFDETHLARVEGERFVSWIQTTLGWLGQHPERDTIKQHLIDGSITLIDLRNRSLRPLESLADLASTRQQWGLFMVSQPIAFRLHVDVQKGNEPWRPIYSTHRQDAFGLEPLLSYRRLRGIYNPRVTLGARDQYAGFVAWLGRTVLTDHPEYDALRVRMERLALATRAQPNQSLGFEHEIRYAREPAP